MLLQGLRLQASVWLFILGGYYSHNLLLFYCTGNSDMWGGVEPAVSTTLVDMVRYPKQATKVLG
jgi:hypothetical protein